jgi:regulation of enolase protein 1 (concanavalin A-like superfamily)
MLRCLFVSLMALGCLSGFLALADDQPTLSIRGWGDIVDSDNDCSIGVDGRKVVVKVPDAAHDFAGELNRWNAPRIVREAKGDFIIDVKVSGQFKPVVDSNIPTRLSYNGAGILLIKDKNNHVSLQRGSVNLNGKVRHYLNFELRKDGELPVSLSEVELADADVHLRLERRGKKVYGMGSMDGVDWTSYEPIEVDFPETLTVAIAAINSSKAPFTCAFEDFAIFRKVTEKAVSK